ncbi:uncharacterized protein EI90DRAFT_844003 [Cantharellus anzutake]|uniref:uncharacterized protein n=1 Tax=Cantharellus anzutake TaxID=1750568 RepID=UPI00190844A2|nr:uncharacterized protein EI90DRAFT_844003 [Cantharellus anzutake]KAF8332280.1 hypothetical protein EI90DRAFT_844003 [Cantharellus anzutake]
MRREWSLAPSSDVHNYMTDQKIFPEFSEAPGMYRITRGVGSNGRLLKRNAMAKLFKLRDPLRFVGDGASAQQTDKESSSSAPMTPTERRASAGETYPTHGYLDPNLEKILTLRLINSDA